MLRLTPGCREIFEQRAQRDEKAFYSLCPERLCGRTFVCIHRAHCSVIHAEQIGDATESTKHCCNITVYQVGLNKQTGLCCCRA